MSGGEGGGERVTQPVISATEPDWSREAKRRLQWAPSRSLLASIRCYQRHEGGRGPWAALQRRFAVWRHRFWSVVTGADIPINCRIGGGLLLPHPNGIVVHPNAVIGPNCLLFQQVTIGMAHGRSPRLGGHVDVGAGARILGSAVVGDHAIIGANAVVVRDVPAGATAIGVPARIVQGDTPPAVAATTDSLSSRVDAAWPADDPATQESLDESA